MPIKTLEHVILIGNKTPKGDQSGQTDTIAQVQFAPHEASLFSQTSLF